MLHITSSRPCASTAAATRASRSARTRMSVRHAIASPPFATMSSTTRARFDIVDVAEHDVRARGREHARARLADARRRAGDARDASGEVEGFHGCHRADTSFAPVRYVGSSVSRVEDPRLLTGRGTFVDDLAPAGMLHAYFVRSHAAHGVLRSIDTSAASAVPGVVLVLTGADLDGVRRAARAAGEWWSARARARRVGHRSRPVRR